MNIEMTATQIVVALFIICLCGVLIVFRNSKETYKGPAECFDCNDHICSVCPSYDPMFCKVRSAYITLTKGGRTVATTTLTFDKDFVHTQHPVLNSMPSMVGMYKTEVMKWADNETQAEVKVTFS